MAQEQADADVRAVREAERNDAGRVEAVGGGRRADELRELIGAHEQVGNVEHTDREAAEEARRGSLSYLAERAEERRARSELPAERHQIVLVAARSVQQQERRTGRARLEDVLEAEVLRGHGASGYVRR